MATNQPQLDLGREIGFVRAQQGWNFLADALAKIQAFSNQPVASAAAAPTTSSTKIVTASSPSAAAASLYVNGQPTNQDALNLTNSVPPAPSGSQNIVWAINNVLNPPQVSGSVTVGTPSEAAVVDLTSQAAALSGTALFTPTATGAYRVSFYAKVTTAASVSSILGGTTGFVLSFTDGGDSVAQMMTLPGSDQNGTPIVIGTGNADNTTTSIYQGMALIYALTSVAVTFSFGYSSSGATVMKYEIHVRAESL